jgi:TonB-linked SusC/RagA family outer membrane protein
MLHYYKRIVFISFFLIALLFSASAFAQQTTITGIIKDAQDQSLISGVSVRVKGTNNGTITGENGEFALEVNPNDTLDVTYIGYNNQQIALNGRTHLTIALAKSTQGLNELVVTALGITKQERAVGYAVQSIGSKQITEAPDPNLVNDLDGKVAGVEITNGGAGVGSTSRIVIRGENSFSGTNQPLFVVDGVPIDNETYFNDAIENSSNQGTWAEVDYGNGAAEINPNDISKITVLKGATAAALYGSRAANGAVILTTKQGTHEDGMLGVSFNSETSIQTPLKLPHLQNEYGAGNGNTPYMYVNGAQSFENNIPNYGLKFSPTTLVDQFNSPAGTSAAGPLMGADLIERSLNPAVDTITPTPWLGHADHFKKFLETGITTMNTISLSGANEKGNFRFSFGDVYNKGILPNTDLRRYTLALRAEHHFGDKLTTNVFLNFINSNSNNRPNIGYGSESVMYTFFGVYGMPMNIDINVLKNKMWETGETNVAQFRYWANHDNPYVTLYDNTNSFNKNRLIGNASLKYQITPDFSAMIRTGSDFYQDDREGHRAFTTVRFPTGGFRTDQVGYFENNSDFLLSFNKKVSRVFSLNLSAGGNRFMQNVSYIRDIANSLIVPGLYNFTNAQNQLPTEYEKFDKIIYSLYAFGDLGFKNMIYLSLTARNDWSSTLPVNHDSYFYPSASLSAIISQMVHLPSAISYLKLRFSAAQVGRDADPYSINNTYLTNTPFGTYPLTTANTVLANSNLKPSTTTSTEEGLEARFLNDRLGLDFTIYSANTSNEVVQLPVPTSSGYTNAYVNGASINNKGIEIELNISPFHSNKNGGFNWDMSFNFSHNVSTVTALPDGINTYVYAQVTQYDRYYRGIQYNAVVGQRLGNMYGNGFVRVPSGQYKGQIIYQNGVPEITSTQDSLLGNYNPNFIVGWWNGLSFKHFNLNFVWDWHQGGKFYSYTELGVLNGGMSVNTLPGRETGIVGKGVMMDATSGKYVPNTVNVSAATYYLGYYNANNNQAFMYSASYLKLREVRLGYTFEHVFSESSPANLNISFVGRNLIEFTQNKDVDPETLALRGQQILPGTEFLSIPATRSMGVSLGLNF